MERDGHAWAPLRVVTPNTNHVVKRLDLLRDRLKCIQLNMAALLKLKVPATASAVQDRSACENGTEQRTF